MLDMITVLNKQYPQITQILWHLWNLWILVLPTNVHDRSLVRILFSLTQNLVCDRRCVAFTKGDVLQ